MNGIKRLASFLVVASVAMGMFNAYGDGEVIVSAIDNANRTATVTFAAAEEGQKLVFAYGKRDYGQDLKEWTRNANLAEYALAVGATSLTVTLPEAWGTTAFYGRFLIKGLAPLPVDALLDFVQAQRGSTSAGTYIKTGIVPNQDTQVELDFEPTEVNITQTLFCSRNGSSGSSYTFSSFIISAQGRFDYYANGSAVGSAVNPVYAANTRYVLKNNGNTASVYKQSDLTEVWKTLTGGNPAGTAFNSYEMVLFMCPSSGSTTTAIPNSNTSSWKLYSFKLRDGEDGPLLADYVPAQKDGVAGIYDYVSNKFIPSANTAYPFIAGSVVEANPQTEAALAWSVPQQGLTGMIGTGGRIFPALDGSGDVVHIFDVDGEFVAPGGNVDLRYLIVGGGGAGASAQNANAGGGGGGGGGVLTNRTDDTFGMVAGTVLRIKVGTGGMAEAGKVGGQGGDSSLSGILSGEMRELVALGGGGGGRATKGYAGGNGGGGSPNNLAGGAGLQEGYNANGEWTTVGFAGGKGGNRGGGGGGGAGMQGGDYETAGAGSLYYGYYGGDGARSDITGEDICYGGGGGGGHTTGYANTYNYGGKGGGGAGACYDASTALAVSGLDGYGGGGGAGAGTTGCMDGANGGSGCVILRYHPPVDRVSCVAAVTSVGAAFMQFNCTLVSLGPVGDSAKLEVAYGPTTGTVGDYQTLVAAWGKGSPFEYTVTGLEVDASYRFVFRVTNNDDLTQSEFEIEAKTEGFSGSGGDVVKKLKDGSMVHIYSTPGKSEFVVPPGGIDLRYLIVGGGGAGGCAAANKGGGGGGGGGVITNATDQLLFIPGGTKISVMVGAGGASAASANGGNGVSSSISATFELDGEPVTMELIGFGGGGGGYNSAGLAGGNGGGGAPASIPGGSAIQTAPNETGYANGTEVIGFVGGKGSSQRGGGGGAGAGQEGAYTSTYVGGVGGDGAWSDITGENICYGGGGGGGHGNGQTAHNVGGAGGGGNGAYDYDEFFGAGTRYVAQPGLDGFGGGGGAGTYVANYYDGANGGSGVVVLRYLPSTDLPEEPYGNLSGIEINDVKVKGDATNVVEEVAYKVEWAGKDADFADVSLVYGASPDALTKEKLLAKNVIGSGTGVCKLTQSWKEGREYYVALKITSGAGTMVTEPVQVSLPKRITPQFPAVMVR